MLRFFTPKPETVMTLANLGLQSLVLGYFASHSVNKTKAPVGDTSTQQESVSQQSNQPR
ncbi:hypothetical protein [Legionella taurinensis]|uniref:hypothetical protein n=1 Tax=Legionella taurinensis TaxID=70611 RepID=UPI000E0572EE|nr:hypothetical protein [Legionella taurinensis]MDX1837937.1 hypothetical protein [Legionella taurinensis]STY25867.1 Uncharacterised protein [Legionella taurinensis]